MSTPTIANPVAFRCSGCGSFMTDNELVEAKKTRPSLLSCCPERKMVPVELVSTPAALEQFTNYFVRNYPGPDTVIFDPTWHAPRIFRAAIAALVPQPRSISVLSDKIERLSVEYSVTDFLGLADWATFEAGITKGLKAAAEIVRAGMSPDAEAVGSWRPISEADKSIIHYILDTKELRIGNSYPIWVRDADGRTYEALWSDNGRQAYWWDIEGESPVNPVEFMPHPLSISTGQRPQQSELDGLELHLKSLVVANPEKALLAAIDDYSRTWFVAELISGASGHVPLTEIEAMVLRHLAPAKGGEA